MLRQGKTLQAWALCFIEQLRLAPSDYATLGPPQALRGSAPEFVNTVQSAHGQRTNAQRVVLGFAPACVGGLPAVAMLQFVAYPDKYDRYLQDALHMLGSLRRAHQAAPSQGLVASAQTEVVNCEEQLSTSR